MSATRSALDIKMGHFTKNRQKIQFSRTHSIPKSKTHFSIFFTSLHVLLCFRVWKSRKSWSFKSKLSATRCAVNIEMGHFTENRKKIQFSRTHFIPYSKTLFSISIPPFTFSHAFGCGEAENHNHFDLKCRQPGAHWTSKWVISRKIVKKFNFPEPILYQIQKPFSRFLYLPARFPMLSDVEKP